ncbi:BUD13 homolog [Diachasmimorpha longicaudata]|uniref:BUD13 homolog n=1 Tax=Diachasmimorpha longicaudata TaxID=58733 RepID=UPI0030B8EDFF
MTKVVVDQKAYLKKYLRSDKDEKKKKKKKVKVPSTNVKIIDDDIDLNHIRPVDEGEFEILNATEDAPQIVGIIDERGPVDFADKRRWKIIADDGDGNVAVSCSQARARDVENESISNESAPNTFSKLLKTDKREINGNSNQTPPRQSRKHSDDDLSPPRKAHSKKKSRKRKDSSSSESSSSSSSNSSSDSECRKKHKSKSHKSSKYREAGPAEKDSDLSPPRPRKRRDSSDLSPVRSRKQRKRSPSDTKRYQNQSDSDMSPPRRPPKYSENSRRRRPDDVVLNPSTRLQGHSKRTSNRRRDSDEDLSPPRRPQRDSRYSRPDKNYDSDFSPPRKFKREKRSDSDLSPPRKVNKLESRSSRRQGGSDSDLSPPRRSKMESKPSRRRGGSDSDLSPPRKSKKTDSRPSRRHEGSDSDLSPPRKSKKTDSRTSRRQESSDPDLSPPRQSRKPDFHSDLSPPRRRRNDERNGKSGSQRDKTESSRRNQEKSSGRKKSRWNEDEGRGKSSSPDIERRMKKTLSGKTAGLLDAVALREETIAHKKRERELFSKMSAEVSGEGQAPVLRDKKTGRRRDLAAEAADKRQKEKEQAEIDEKYAKWGRGLKQVSDQTQKLKDDLYEMSKPLARYADDVDLDSQQRAAEHAEDPMLAYIKDKQIKEGKREPDAPTYEGSFMPNRFGIKPGHRWDGVDRSNGYEKKWFDARNARAATQDEAYKWSSADM